MTTEIVKFHNSRRSTVVITNVISNLLYSEKKPNESGKITILISDGNNWEEASHKKELEKEVRGILEIALFVIIIPIGRKAGEPSSPERIKIAMACLRIILRD